METYKKIRLGAMVAALFYVVTFAFQSVEVFALRWIFLVVAFILFRKAHFEEKKIHGDNPEGTKRRKRLAYIIVRCLYGFVIILLIVSRFLAK